MIKALKFLLILLVVIIGALLLKRVAERWHIITNKIAGGSERSIHRVLGGANPAIVSEAMTTLKPTLDEIGGDEHLVKYLSGVLGSSKPTLRELIEEAVDRTLPANVEELFMYFDIRYANMISPANRAILESKRIPLVSKDLVTLMVNQAFDRTGKDYSQRVKTIDRMTAVSGQFRRFDGPIAKKSPAVLKKMSISLDTAPMKALVNVVVGYNPVASAPTIEQKLEAVDLIEMYPREPYKVKNFIERIRRQIAIIDKSSDWTNSPMPIPAAILRDVIRENIFADTFSNGVKKGISLAYAANQPVAPQSTLSAIGIANPTPSTIGIVKPQPTPPSATEIAKPPPPLAEPVDNVRIADFDGEGPVALESKSFSFW